MAGDILYPHLRTDNLDYETTPQTGTWIHGLLIEIEIAHLVSELNEAQFLDVSAKREFSERQSDRWEVDLFRKIHIPWVSLVAQLLKHAQHPCSIAGSGGSPREGIGYPLQYSWASLVTQLVKNLPSVWETWVQSLGWEDPLEKGMTTHSRILAWRIPWTEEPGSLQSMGLQRVGQEWSTFTFSHSIDRIQFISKGKNNPGRNTLHRKSMGHLRRQETRKYGVVSFYGLGNFIG